MENKMTAFAKFNTLFFIFSYRNRENKPSRNAVSTKIAKLSTREINVGENIFPSGTPTQSIESFSKHDAT